MHSSINKRIKKQAAEDKMTMTAVKDQESIHETAHWINRTANSKHLEQSKPQVSPYINALDFLFSEQMIFEYEELEKKIKYDPLLKEKKERFDRIIHYIEEYFNIVITDNREKLLVDLCNAANIHFGPPIYFIR
ncbi:hypothetical protein ACQUEW_12285 [Enterococcus casseliflavus]